MAEMMVPNSLPPTLPGPLCGHLVLEVSVIIALFREECPVPILTDWDGGWIVGSLAPWTDVSVPEPDRNPATSQGPDGCRNSLVHRQGWVR